MKKIMSKTYLGILDKERQSVFQQLSQFKTDGYLAGGTALSLQIKHRKSFDFDIFIPKQITTSLKSKVRKIFKEPVYYIDSKDQISFRTANNINVTFLWYYFDYLFPLIPTDSLSLASIKDIAADKAHTIGRRAAWRDYVDLFFLLKNQLITIKELCILAEKKLGGEFNKALFLQQLSYFKDIEETKVEFINQSYSFKEIKQYLEIKVEEYIKEIII